MNGIWLLCSTQCLVVQAPIKSGLSTKAVWFPTRLSKLSSLSISSLRRLDEEANKFYDRKHNLYEAALLTRYYTQHALRPYIDSVINHIMHFIKIPFINKRIEFIDLPSIFRDNTIISSIPSYFENTESPIICYKYMTNLSVIQYLTLTN